MGEPVSLSYKQSLLQSISTHYYAGHIMHEQWIHDCIKENKFINPSKAHILITDTKGELKISKSEKKSLYTVLEVIELWHEIQRIKKDNNTYKFKGNLSSRALWSRVEFLNNIPQRSGESMRNFFK